MIPNWLDRIEYPFISRFTRINGHRVHYIDEGKGDVLLFVHGTPSWSFDFRHQIKVLSRHYRCIALDHIGFGLSDKPSHYDYSTSQHALTLQQFIDHLQLRNITLIVHDFGGPIGLHYAVNNAQNISRLVILNTWMWSSEGEPAFEKFKKVLRSPLLPFLYKYCNFSPRFLLPASFGDKKLKSSLLKQYTSPYKKISERQGPLAFAKSLLNDQEWFESIWQKRKAITEKPILLIWGMKDKFIHSGYFDKFREAFPKAEGHKLETCGHFPQEEESPRVTAFISKFLTQTP